MYNTKNLIFWQETDNIMSFPRRRESRYQYKIPAFAGMTRKL